MPLFRSDDLWDGCSNELPEELAEARYDGRLSTTTTDADGEMQVRVFRPATARVSENAVETRPDPNRPGWVIDIIIPGVAIGLLLAVPAYLFAANIITLNLPFFARAV